MQPHLSENSWKGVLPNLTVITTVRFFYYEPSETRTPDTLIKSQVLYIIINFLKMLDIKLFTVIIQLAILFLTLF